MSLALASVKSDNQYRDFGVEDSSGEITMVGLSGLEKFSHLEDKIYRTIELTKTLRQEKENLEKELSIIHRDMGNVLNEKERLETQVEKLLAERETIRMKVEAMLDAVAALDPEMAEELR
jgi:FtsZ-binding cell division protein ZapB